MRFGILESCACGSFGGRPLRIEVWDPLLVKKLRGDTPCDLKFWDHLLIKKLRGTPLSISNFKGHEKLRGAPLAIVNLGITSS